MTTGWHRADIRAAVEKKGKTLTQLALDNGLNEAACRLALRCRHRDGELAISAFIAVPAWVLWPGRWRKPAAQGLGPTRVDNRFRPKYRRSADPSHRQKAEAA